MSKSFYSIFEDVQTEIKKISSNEYLASVAASVDSTLLTLGENEGRFHKYPKLILDRKLSKDTLLKLAILSWYVPKNLGFLLRLEIEERIKNNIDLIEVNFCLQTKNQMLLFLSDFLNTKTGNQIFGNFLNKKTWLSICSRKCFYLKIRRNFKLKNEPSFHKRTIGVGYRDKGNLAEISSGNPNRFLDFTSLQNQIEKNRQSVESSKLILEGFLL